MSNRHIVLSLVAVLAFVCVALDAMPTEAQACPSGSTCFYVPPAMVGPAGPDTVSSEIRLSIPSGTATGTYSVDGGAPVGFSITSTAALQVPLALTAMSSAIDTAEARGVFVVSSREDLLVEHKQALFMSGAYTEGYPETVPRHTVALGTRFRLGGFRMTSPSPLTPPWAATSQYLVVYAPSDATVTLTAPPGATLPYWTGSTTDSHAITLAAGESATLAANAALDGALLTSTAPVTVSAGGRGWLSPCGDDGADVLVPTSQWGTQFAVRLPTGTAAGSDVSVIADVDDTEVRVDGALVATLAAGERHAFVPTAATYIETSQPALVWMNGGFGTCELDTALIPPLELVALPLAVTFNAAFAGEGAIVIPTAELAAVTLDGAALAPTMMPTVPTRPDMTIAVFSISAGLHTVAADHGFQLLATSVGAGAGILAYFGPFVACTTDTACEDLGPCTTEACVTNACVATPIEAGTPGDCEPGLVCSGEAAAMPNACVAPEPPADGGVADAGAMDDGGPVTPADGGGATDAGARDGGAPPPGDGGGAGVSDGGGPVTMTDGGCCAVFGTRGDRGVLPVAFTLALFAVVARRRRRRASPRGRDT